VNDNIINAMVQNSVTANRSQNLNQFGCLSFEDLLELCRLLSSVRSPTLFCTTSRVVGARH
jgi:hypothetical protein